MKKTKGHITGVTIAIFVILICALTLRLYGFNKYDLWFDGQGTDTFAFKNLAQTAILSGVSKSSIMVDNMRTGFALCFRENRRHVKKWALSFFAVVGTYIFPIFIRPVYIHRQLIIFSLLGNNVSIFYSSLPCSPCLSAYNHCKSACRDNKCLQAISSQEVYDALSKKELV